jgi:hypothetical protein
MLTNARVHVSTVGRLEIVKFIAQGVAPYSR